MMYTDNEPTTFSMSFTRVWMMMMMMMMMMSSRRLRQVRRNYTACLILLVRWNSTRRRLEVFQWMTWIHRYVQEDCFTLTI